MLTIKFRNQKKKTKKNEKKRRKVENAREPSASLVGVYVIVSPTGRPDRCQN